MKFLHDIAEKILIRNIFDKVWALVKHSLLVVM